MKVAVALLTAVLISCSQVTPPAAAVRSPSSPASTSCRLPISMVVDVQGSVRGAFLDFPAGTVTVDPSGIGGAYYDRRFKRWLSVAPNAVSTDESRYAYLEKWGGFNQRGRLHVVDLLTYGDRLYEIGSTSNQLPFVIVAVAPEGIWLSNRGYEAPGGNLFLLDLATGVLKDVGGPSGQHITEPIVGEPGVFWFTDPGPNPDVAPIGFPIPERVMRFTVATGVAETWFSKHGSYVRVLGTDLAGHPIISTTVNGAEAAGETIWLATSATAVSEIGVLHGATQSIADSHGIWFGSSQGIYLYSDADGLQKVSNQPGYPANGCF